MDIIKVTPSLDELLKTNKTLKCSESECSMEFKSLVNMRLHLQKHHKMKVSLKRDKPNSARTYHCPDKNCIYYDHSQEVSQSNQGDEKFFSCMKYLRQHYLKVHAEKHFKCRTCDKTFSHATLLRGHEKTCGQIFACAECGWKYNTREALLTHSKRKNHNHAAKAVKGREIGKMVDPAKTIDQSIQTEAPKSATTGISKTTTTTGTKKRQFSQMTQTLPKKLKLGEAGTQTTESLIKNPQQYSPVFDESDSNLIDNSSQTTNNLNNMNYFEDSVSCFVINQFSIETQTDPKSVFNLDSNLDENLDQMFYSNMHTQTCDDILSDFGLSNIQTQTNWDYNDLFVSTETQTCFSKCLLENSSIQTQTSKSMEFLCDVGSADNVLNSNSIHTQTYCEP